MDTLEILPLPLEAVLKVCQFMLPVCPIRWSRLQTNGWWGLRSSESFVRPKSLASTHSHFRDPC